jgi:hypothetical protein
MATLSPSSDPPASASTQVSTLIVRPEQGPFTDAEKAFMLPYLERYMTASSAHGDKKKWVKDNVYPEFLKKYDSAGPRGPNLSSLLTVS